MLSNNEIKHINSLKIKKYRNKYSEFIAEGKKVITELIQNGIICKKIYILDNDGFYFPDEINIEVITLQDLKKISNQANPSSHFAIFEIPKIKSIDIIQDWVIALDNIQDPGNLGTIIRIADWFGIKNVICSDNCVDIYNPKTIQASMASIANVNVIETNLIDFFQKHDDVPIMAAMLNGKNIQSIKFPEKGIVLIGNEGKGISVELLEYIDTQITIPKFGKAESLNAAVATSIIIAQIKLA
jgi:TrmH family RNA methyltransferase